MAKKKKKYYVVWEGNKPGIYTDWNECHKQLKGYSKPVFKAFSRIDVAEKAFFDDPQNYLNENYTEPTLFTLSKPGKKKQKPQSNPDNIPLKEALTVDAACSGNPGVMEYRGVDLATKKEVFKQGPFPLGTNNIGEFLALVHGLAHLKRTNSSLPIYSDSTIAIGWVKRKIVKTQLPRNEKTESLFKLVDRALIWIKQNQWNTKILKWETKAWGEIPADFGRK